MASRIASRRSCWSMREALLLTAALLVAPVAHAQAGADARRSGITYATPSTQALQQDDSQNPAMLWVADGRVAWNKVDGEARKACADCHGKIESMRGVAPRYPAVAAASQRVVNLGQQINQCRSTRQRAPALAAESDALLALETAIAFESRGMAIAPSQPAPAALKQAQARGKALFHERIGHVALSCHDCHDTLAGKRLGAAVIPQGHATGYPIYRLEWQKVGSLQRRLRNCMTAVRAETPAWSAQELVDLEAWLMLRAAGMPLETPGVRP